MKNDDTLRPANGKAHETPWSMVIAFAHQTRECVQRSSHGVPGSKALQSEGILVKAGHDHVEFPWIL